LASARPLGKVSVNATPVRLPAALGFVMVNVRLVFPARGMLAAPNDFAIVGGENTVTVAFAVFPAPAVVEVTATLLFCTPAVVPVTFTEKVHEVLVGKVVPARLTTVAPEAAVIVPPPHDPVRPFGEETDKPAGRPSVKATPVSGMVFAGGFVIVKLSEVVPPSGMVGAPKVLVICGELATVKVAVLLTTPDPPLVEVTAPVTLLN